MPTTASSPNALPDPLARDTPLASPDEAALPWLAAGVRHEILLRVLPVQRHDILGPLSVMRMSAAVLRRRLAQQPPDLAICAGRVVDLDTQLAQAVTSVSALRPWDAHYRERRDARQAAQEALALARPSLALRQHRVSEPLRAADLPADEDTEPVDVPAFAYGLLGLVFHAADAADGPRALTLFLGLDELLIESAPFGANERAPGNANDLPPRTQGHPIDARAFEWLMRDLGWQVETLPQGWRVRWSAAA